MYCPEMEVGQQGDTARIRTFVHRSRIPASGREVYRWHTEPGALQRLVPPWEQVEVVEEGALENGALVVLRVGLGPVRRRWISRIDSVIPGRQFRDVQVRGPFALWEHTHRVVPDGESACWLEDWVLYALPFGLLGRLIGDRLVRGRLVRLFEYRHRRTLEAFAGEEERARMSPMAPGSGTLFRFRVSYSSVGDARGDESGRSPVEGG